MADPACLNNPLKQVDFSKEGITTIIWADRVRAGFQLDQANTFDEKGAPVHQFVSVEPACIFLACPGRSRRGSTCLWGVWHDAKYIADQSRSRSLSRL